MSNPERTDCQLEFPAPEHKQAMMAAENVLSPKAAMIARKIPRIAPMLRMIEEGGFEVVGFEAAPALSKPVRMLHTSVGCMVFYQLLKRRGYTVALSDPPESDSGKAVSV